jgi:hypothetical protein
MMQIEIGKEIHDLRLDVTNIDKNVVKMNGFLERAIDDSKDQQKDINKLKKFKNKLIGALTLSHIALILLPILIAIL